MKVGDVVKISWTKGATSRTKNRIRENGPTFIVHSLPKGVAFDKGNELWVSFKSVAHRTSDGNGGKEAWHGWLPVAEIEVISESR